MWNGHVLYFETPEFARSSPVSSGLFAFPIDSAGSSIGYCIDEGSFETAANTYDRAELTKLSALPDCTTATAYDEITGCVLD
jgi:hypothetical protein